jgi:hypothetical protein
LQEKFVEVYFGLKSVLWIRTQFFRIRIHNFFLDSDTDSDY